ncbi:MAG: dienelactone hydrolase family protein [Verrucomicrobiota bacterium]|nr:dienelactone hydrolase family protein [Verrucomicrobiota bacterium]
MSACATAPSSRDQPFTVAEKEFTSHGVKILVDVYTPAGRRTGAAHPPVLVLHGAGGMLFDGPEMSRVARELATAGFEAYQVHYFDRTHTWFARQAVLLQLFPTWRETVHDAVTWVQAERPDARKVGIFGYSLGAFAGIEEARRNPAIGAVVEQAGGFWNAHPEGATRQPLPPILLIHGLEDQRVPFAKYARPLLAFLRAHDDPFATHFYPGEGHNFSPSALHRVRAETVAFFQRHLSGHVR